MHVEKPTEGPETPKDEGRLALEKMKETKQQVLMRSSEKYSLK